MADESLKEIYEMGKRLMEMAEEQGYSAEGEEEVEAEEPLEDEKAPMPYSGSKKDKSALALSLFKNG